MSRYIDADKLKEKLMCADIYYEDKTRTYHQFYKAEDVDEQPTADVVSREAYEQIKWERDIAIAQLEELGYGLGEEIRHD